MKISAGTLLWRRGPSGLEVLLIHSSGSYNRKAPWGIPKGIPDEGEELEAAARRETIEETGVEAGALEPLGYVAYRKSGKRIHCWAGEAPDGAAPRCASWEVDCSEFVPIGRAREVIHPDQAPLLDRLEELLGRKIKG